MAKPSKRVSTKQGAAGASKRMPQQGGKASVRTSKKVSKKMPAPSGRQPSARTSARTSARSAPAAPPPSARQPAAKASGRTSKKARRRAAEFVSDEYVSRKRQARAGNKKFGLFFVVAVGGFFLIALIGLVGYWQAFKSEAFSRNEQILSYNSWVNTNLNTFKNKVNPLVDQLKPIYEDTPKNKVTDKVDGKEFSLVLTARYEPVLQATGATYGFCRKGWKIKNKQYGLNVSTTGSQQFMQTPAKSLELSERKAEPMINGARSLSASYYMCWDKDANRPLIIITLNLAPPPPADADPSVKPIEPTSFVLWFAATPPTGDAEARLRFLMKSGAN